MRMIESPKGDSISILCAIEFFFQSNVEYYEETQTYILVSLRNGTKNYTKTLSKSELNGICNIYEAHLA